MVYYTLYLRQGNCQAKLEFTQMKNRLKGALEGLNKFKITENLQNVIILSTLVLIFQVDKCCKFDNASIQEKRHRIRSKISF